MKLKNRLVYFSCLLLSNIVIIIEAIRMSSNTSFNRKSKKKKQTKANEKVDDTFFKYDFIIDMYKNE